MTVTELAKLVKEARVLQKIYFKVRTQTALEASKKAERQLDDAVSDVLEPANLFGKLQ
jgi:hypothetical protein